MVVTRFCLFVIARDILAPIVSNNYYGTSCSAYFINVNAGGICLSLDSFLYNISLASIADSGLNAERLEKRASFSGEFFYMFAVFENFVHFR